MSNGKSNILDFLPEKSKNEPEKLVQAKIPESLYNAVRPMMDADNYAWRDIMIAACEQYRELKKCPKKRKSRS